MANNFVKERRKRSALELFKKLLGVFLLATLGLIALFIFVGVVISVVVSLKSGSSYNLFVKIYERLFRGSRVDYIFSNLIKSNKGAEEVKFIEGIESVPVYPNAEFVYEALFRGKSKSELMEHPPNGYSKEDLTEIFKFIGAGQSIYFMPSDTTWSKVAEFYRSSLPKYGWEYILTVEIDDLEKEPGDYYINNEKNLGLRIYSLANDIWYEVIPKDSAITGLSNRVREYREKIFKVESEAGSTVPKSSGWKFKYPNSWKLSTEKVDRLGGIENLYFSGRNSSTLSLKGVQYTSINFIDLTYGDIEKMAKRYVDEFLKKYNKNRDKVEQISSNSFIVNRRVVNELSAVEYTKAEGNNMRFLFIPHRTNGLLYVLEYNGVEAYEFYNSILSEIK